MQKSQAMKTAAMVLMAAAVPLGAMAAPQIFDFKDPKGVNHASFKLDGLLETISGNANGVSGTLAIDVAKPEATAGTILIEAKTLNVENSVMREHMLGKDWLDVASHPVISFKVTSLEDFKMAGDTATARVKGKFLLKGVEKEISVPAKVTLLRDKLAARSGGKQQGDLVVLRTEFSIKRSDYGVNPKAPTDKVSDEVVISLAIAGASPK